MLTIDCCGNSIITVKILILMEMTRCQDLWKYYDYYLIQKLENETCFSGTGSSVSRGSRDS